jgi:transcriptional regulator with XRE-family HTH domain
MTSVIPTGGITLRPVLRDVKSYGYRAPVSQPESWPAELADVIAGEVRRYRRQRGLSAQQLADRCAELGMPIQRSVLANLENGRRPTVTVAELLVLAAALSVEPVLLVFPVGHQAVSRFLPAKSATTWSAAQWFAGRAALPVSPSAQPGRDEARRRFGGTMRAADQDYPLPIRLYEAHERAMDELTVIRRNIADLRVQAQTRNGDVAQVLRAAEDNLSARTSILRDLRQQIRDHGMEPPALDAATAAGLGEDVASSPVVGESS